MHTVPCIPNLVNSTDCNWGKEERILEVENFYIGGLYQHKKIRPNDVLVLDLGLHNDSPQVTNTRDTIKNLLRQEVGAV